MGGVIPNFVGTIQAAAPLIIGAILVALFLLALDGGNWPDKSKWRR